MSASISAERASSVREYETPADELSLLATIQQGKGDQALAKIQALYGQRLERLARRMLSDVDDAADAYQEALIAIHRALPHFQGRARIYTWLYRVAVHALLTWQRKRQRLLVRENHTRHSLQRRHRGGPRPEEVCEEHFRRQILRGAIAELPATQRLTWRLFTEERMPIVAIARMLGDEPGAVKVRLHRARNRLRRSLARRRLLPGEETLGHFALLDSQEVN